ncbi:hypothetical protein ABZX95_38640 [Streptomyces sp. NPDC004232]|uniref:hypothetical protein n=1 Tax=Streptomyces sp. NPDC004232 TaxID=3154454 RepID=UPI0033AC0684
MHHGNFWEVLLCGQLGRDRWTSRWSLGGVRGRSERLLAWENVQGRLADYLEEVGLCEGGETSGFESRPSAGSWRTNCGPPPRRRMPGSRQRGHTLLLEPLSVRVEPGAAVRRPPARIAARR